jgi:hypothetical protein
MNKTISCTVTGLKYVSLTPDAITELKTAIALTLVRDKKNQHDSNAIQVWLGQTRVGFISRRDAAVLAPSIDSGSEVTNVKPGRTEHLSLQSRSFKVSVTVSRPNIVKDSLKPLKSICPGPGIYRIRFKLDGQAYVGQSSRIDKRIGGHRANLVMGVHSNRNLQDLWNRNTPRDFAIEVLEEAPKGLDALSLQNWLGEREVFWIAQERSRGTSLNIEDGGFVETKASEKGYQEYVKKFDAAVRIEKRKIREQLKVAREHQSKLRQSLMKVERNLELKRQAYKRARGWFDRLTGHHTIEARRCMEVLDVVEAEHEAVRSEFQGAAREVYRLEESHRKHKTIKQLDNAFRRVTRLY